ncbi:MAG: hypothetical protein NTZ74_08595 [Chloroflexi bacterium]|nr:hypothetical protein [Chloroflexota bacterium]
MHLGKRKIRSAGRTSGSVEITLPAILHVLEGTMCQLVVRDGPRPEIVLQPDLTLTQDLFNNLWQKIQIGLAEIGELPDFSLADFTPTFFPLQAWQDRPPLSYVDALLVIQQQNQRLPAPHTHLMVDEDALTRILASLGVNAGYHFGLQGRFSLAFGDSVSYLVSGNPTSLGTDFERGMAHRLFWEEDSVARPFYRIFEDREWKQACFGFRRVFDQFLGWQETPNSCAIARDQWYRALTAEMKVF